MAIRLASLAILGTCGRAFALWDGPFDAYYSDVDCPNLGCYGSAQAPWTVGECEAKCDADSSGCNALNYGGGGCCLRGCSPGKLVTPSLHGSQSYRRVASPAPAPSQGIRFSNVFGDGMVLQRAPEVAVIWGFGTPGVSVSTLFQDKQLPGIVVGADGVWRQHLPATSASKVPVDIVSAGSDGSTVTLKSVLFGDVFLCSGQSNMQVTPYNGYGGQPNIINVEAEVHEADEYGDGIRFFTVGMQTQCGNVDCSQPFLELDPNVTHDQATCPVTTSCREPWEHASLKSLGGKPWSTFSSTCWFYGRYIYDTLGHQVPVGLVSSNWGGTPIEYWMDGPYGTLYNSMIAPFAVGPMSLKGVLWYQGESNVGAAQSYAVNFPNMITSWRTNFNNPSLWFGFVQVAGFCYPCWDAGTVPGVPNVLESLAAGDLRQAQLAALQLENVGMSTAIDTGDFQWIHPADKQNPSRRLAKQALNQIYGFNLSDVEFPMLAGSKFTIGQDMQVIVSVDIRAAGKPVTLTTEPPSAATQTSNPGGFSIARNECVTAYSWAGKNQTFPEYCGYPMIIGHDGNGQVVSLNATASIGDDATSILLEASAAGVATGFTVVGSSYGRAAWPMTVFFAHELPVIPWYTAIGITAPWTPLSSMPDEVAEASTIKSLRHEMAAGGSDHNLILT